jgi:hypothetical protein
MGGLDIWVCRAVRLAPPSGLIVSVLIGIVLHPDQRRIRILLDKTAYDKF